MTRMIPDTIHSRVRSGAERRIFKKIKTSPKTEDWICLHSLGLAHHPTKRRAEIDFLLLTPDGVFVLEVKGGRIKRERGVWYYTNKYNETAVNHEGPFVQASSAMFSLERSIKSIFAGTKLANVLFGYGVIIPDVLFESLGIEDSPELIYDKDNRNEPFPNYIQRLAKYTRETNKQTRYGLNKDRINKLADYLRGDFDLVPTLNTVLQDTNSALTSLTEEQYSTLDSLQNRPRMIVEGVAGSGKTMLAIELTRRDVRSGKRVLFLCYNRNLAAHINSVLESEQIGGSVVVKTLHSNFHHLITHSSLADEFNEERNTVTEQTLFDTIYPEYALHASLETSVPPFDKIIVDEAQDILSEPNVLVLDNQIRNGIENGEWVFFLDSNNQASVYGNIDEATLENLRQYGIQTLLNMNCRNTRPVANQTNIISNPRLRAIARVDGPPVDLIYFSDRKEKTNKLIKTLEQLKSKGVNPATITVLFARDPTPEEKAILERYDVKELEISSAALMGTTMLEYSTWSCVSGFKGLENDSIIFLGIDSLDDDWSRAINYVAMSRARIFLYVFIHENCRTAYEKRSEIEYRSELEKVD